MCALVTGGAGFVGSHLVDRLLKEGYKVKIIDNFSSGTMENLAHHKDDPNIEVVLSDLKNKENTIENVRDINVVFHLAANPEVRVGTTNPEIHFNENLAATFNLLEAIRKNNVKGLVFASSSSVYGEPAEIPVREDAAIRPISIYGASKAACEALMHAYSFLYGIKTVVLRFANITGPRLRHGAIYDLILKLLADSAKLEILGDGTQTRSYVYVEDAVEATLTSWKLGKNRFDTFNVGSEDWITIKEVADVITQSLGLNAVEYSFKPAPHGVGWVGDVKRIALAIDRIGAHNFKPTLTSKEAVQKTVIALKDELQIQKKTP
jgi:UDP-glucose 4-epimerase